MPLAGSNGEPRPRFLKVSQQEVCGGIHAIPHHTLGLPAVPLQAGPRGRPRLPALRICSRR